MYTDETVLVLNNPVWYYVMGCESIKITITCLDYVVGCESFKTRTVSDLTE
jgi:hypothetical protein